MIALIILGICSVINSFLLILAYSLGLKNGRKLDNNEEIEMPRIIERKTNNNQFSTDNFNEDDQTEWENINNYNGSSIGQKDFESEV